MKASIALAVGLALAGCGNVGVLPVALPTAVASPVAPSVAPLVTDDTAALQALLNLGGTVTLEARTYHTTKSLFITKSGTVLQGAGNATVIEYAPPATIESCKSAAAIQILCGPANTMPQALSTPIAIGDTSIQVANSAGLSVGDWLIVGDWGVFGTYTTVVDWVQVASISGNSLGLTSPARVSVSTTRPFAPFSSGAGWMRAVPVSGVVLQDLTVRVDDAGNTSNVVAIYLEGTRNTVVTRVTVDNPLGNPLTGYFSKGATFSYDTVVQGRVISEFASAIDLTIEHCQFNRNVIGLDLGTAFFKVLDNVINGSENTGIYALYGVHDGTISGNTVGYVGINGDANATGILMEGDQNVSVSGNTLLGGAGSASVGVYNVSYVDANWNLPATGNTFTSNIIQGFTTALVSP